MIINGSIRVGTGTVAFDESLSPPLGETCGCDAGLLGVILSEGADLGDDFEVLNCSGAGLGDEVVALICNGAGLEEDFEVLICSGTGLRDDVEVLLCNGANLVDGVAGPGDAAELLIPWGATLGIDAEDPNSVEVRGGRGAMEFSF